MKVACGSAYAYTDVIFIITSKQGRIDITFISVCARFLPTDHCLLLLNIIRTCCMMLLSRLIPFLKQVLCSIDHLRNWLHHSIPDFIISSPQSPKHHYKFILGVSVQNLHQIFKTIMASNCRSSSRSNRIRKATFSSSLQCVLALKEHMPLSFSMSLTHRAVTFVIQLFLDQVTTCRKTTSGKPPKHEFYFRRNTTLPNSHPSPSNSQM